MSILLILLPGPDTAVATKNTIVNGRAGGMKTVLGTLTALLIHTFAAVLGLSALIVKSAFLFSILKYAGACYLIFLGLKSLWTINKQASLKDHEEQKSDSKSINFYRQGFLTNLLNPKVAVFFLTFLPQFLEPGLNTFTQFMIMGLTYTILTFIWFIIYIYLIHQLSAFMIKPAVQKWMEGITGAVLIGFGIKLAFERK
ncbi:LysE family translocator [Metabacillus idriensis]|uniref:LysE family translocator n=1 Tax=Metabacillus idriensis TaxID=324768 RepID=UPI0028135D30|nr:LysE family translocator [Metabacillus idriensis]MDR0137642.1 LysE family translocator [Metabacillus idriensis]